MPSSTRRPDAEPDRVARRALEEARSVLPTRRPIRFEWRDYRVTAGRAYLRENLICLSRRLLATPARIRATVLHEYAHLYVFERFGASAKPHGPEWAEAMRNLGRKPEVTHAYPCRRNRVRKPLAYKCAKCGERIDRARPLSRGYTYYHIGCGGKIAALGAQTRKKRKCR
ncbi:MAG: SprT-like domain-containing protein [Armatimonadetes bacterium]|nr:SprT-like domain-containing protein [Armatimonadota bacterium]